MVDTDSALSPHFPVLKVTAFVDATTVVLVGVNMDQLGEGDELYILAFGDSIVPGASVPLVAPKAHVEVTFNAGAYILARSPLEPTLIAGLEEVVSSLAGGSRMVSQRKRLTTDESQFLGNPARTQVKLGDIVVPVKRIADYMKWRGEHSNAPGVY